MSRPAPLASKIPALSTENEAVPRTGLRWPARLDSLRVKLFLAIAGANALLALVAFLVFSWSFDQGFVEYLNRADENRLQPLVVRLAEGYRSEGNWKWVAEDRRRWSELVREVFGIARSNRRPEDNMPAGTSAIVPRPSPPRPAPGPPPQGPPQPGGPPDPLLTIDPRLLLFDASHKLLAGREEMAGEAVLKAITSDGRTVGYLGYVPRLKMVTSLEKLFSYQQGRKFAAIAVGMLVAGLLIGAVLAQWLSMRIRRLAQGANALIQGRYDMRIESQGNDELAHLAKDFNQLAQTLEAAQRARQQWIADIAHELRTPLAVLRAEIEALLDGVRPLSLHNVGSLAQEVSQLSRLVDDLRLLSLSDLGALSYHKEPLDLGELIDECVRPSGRSGASGSAFALEGSGLQVRLDLGEPVMVLGDGARLAQVFGNLLQNTLRYTDSRPDSPGNLHIGLSLVPGDPSRAQVSWEDSSPGVPEPDLPRLTERLFRVDSSRSRAGGGSGLGLAITKAIVEAHGGDMLASRSELGGLRWTLRFPVSQRGAAEPAAGETGHG